MVTRSRLDQLLKKYNKVFQEGLGFMRILKQQLKLKADAMPRLHHPQPDGPFALKEAE